MDRSRGQAALVARKGIPIGDLDLRIMREMELDGRQSASQLAKKLGISRAYASRRLQGLLNRNVIKIAAFTSPLALGHRILTVTGVRVSPDKLYRVTDRLRALPSVNLLVITAGWQDIVIWSTFASPERLSMFLAKELGSIPGIESAETMLVIEWHAALSYLSTRQWRTMVFLQPPSEAPTPFDHERQYGAAAGVHGGRDGDHGLDLLDLQILAEMERNGRQLTSDLAGKLGASRAKVSSRLRRLRADQVTRIVSLTNPLDLGYHTYAMMGLKVAPKEIDRVVAKVKELPNVHLLARVIGRYDLVVWTMFRHPNELSRFLGKELGAIPGILSVESLIGLELRKMSFSYLASTYLRAMEQEHPRNPNSGVPLLSSIRGSD